jgi:hypothetical protein
MSKARNICSKMSNPNGIEKRQPSDMLENANLRMAKRNKRNRSDHCGLAYNVCAWSDALQLSKNAPQHCRENRGENIVSIEGGARSSLDVFPGFASPLLRFHLFLEKYSRFYRRRLPVKLRSLSWVRNPPFAFTFSSKISLHEQTPRNLAGLGAMAR